LELEDLVLDGGLVAHNRVGDIGADVKGRSPGRRVAGAFLASDRPPGKRCSLQTKLSSAVAGQVERGVAPEERIPGRVRGRVSEHREDEALRVPEGVAVVAGPSQPFRGDRSLLRPRA